MGHLDHFKTGTSKAQPAQALTDFEGLGANITRARNASAGEEK